MSLCEVDQVTFENVPCADIVAVAELKTPNVATS